MYRIAKTLHIIGLTLFLGSIFAHIVAGQVSGGPGSESFAYGRTEISAATRFLTMPGLMLAMLSGLWMAGLARLSPRRQPWIAVHAGMAGAVLLIATTLVIPAGKKMLAGGGLDEIDTALTLEHVAGGVNILLTLALIVIGVFKPRWDQTRRAPKQTNETP